MESDGSSSFFSSLEFGVKPFIFAAVFVILTAAYRWYTQKYYVKILEPSPYLKSQSVIVDTKTGTRTSVLGRFTKFDESMTTLYDVFKHGINGHPEKDCLGKRESFDAPIKWLSYGEVGQKVHLIGSGITHLCVDHNADQSEKIIVGIFARNSVEWVCTFLTCSAYGFVAVPLYETLGTEGLKHICQQAEPTVVLCDNLKAAREVLEWSTAKLKHVVIVEKEDEVSKLHNQDARTLSFDELCNIGRQFPSEPKPPSQTDLAIIRYTSGSVGLPKGVLCTHKNYISSLKGAMKSTELVGSLKNFTHLAFLPLAHSYEQLNIGSVFYYGAREGFLTKDIKGLVKDLQAYRPDVLPVVPRILVRFYTAAMTKVNKYKPLHAIVNYVIHQRLQEQSRGIYRKNGLVDYLVFRPVRDACGGRIQYVICGSAPLSAEVLQFTRAAFSCPVVEGYGLTETGASLSATLVGEPTSGHTGALANGVTVKLADVPEMDVQVKRDGMGEICVKSEQCTDGYYKDEKKTRELFDTDGFLRTGDIGTWTKEGALKIVDRCKNIFKLAQGEYISPKKIEELYSSSPLVVNIYVEGNPLSTFIVGVIEPDLKLLTERMIQHLVEKSADISDQGLEKTKSMVNKMSAEEICESQTAKNIVLNELTEIGRKGGLKGFEQVRAIHLTTEHFEIGNGLLTPTLKLSRPNVRRHFGPVIKALYEESHAE